MDRFALRVYRVANGICSSSADAEEVVQDVFLTAFRKAGSFEGRAAIGTWLYRIAVNAALNNSATRSRSRWRTGRRRSPPPPLPVRADPARC
jgi:RNA polymerase sigma factor (sigma-70 family)